MKKRSSKDTPGRIRFGKYRWMAVALLVPAILFLVKHSANSLKDWVPALFLPISVILFVTGNKIEERETLKQRKENLKKSFPEFAMKISMLIRAGYSPRGAMEKVAGNYLKKRKGRVGPEDPLYEEVVMALREMESGTSETEAYEHLEQRCGVFEISRFCGFLIRAVKRGAAGLGEELKEESRKAVSAQKEIVRKKGETAGTRLLFPMMLFLLIVMVMILYPAFESLSML